MPIDKTKSRPNAMIANSNSRTVSACLIGLAIALLVVGVVSGTLLRHIIQILPIILAVALVRQRPDWGAYAALPILLFWLLVALLIWAFLLGLSGIASGRYTVVEIICTVFMAGFSTVGVWASIGVGRTLRAAGRISAFISVAVLQVAVMWISFLKPIANR